MLEDFQLLDIEPFDNSVIKRDFLKVYHQQGAQLNQSDQNVEFVFGENNKYHQIGIIYLEFDITVRPNAGNFIADSPIRMTNNALAYVFKEARLSTTSGSDLEQNKFLGQVSAIMRTLTSKDDDLLSQFDNNNEEVGVDDNATADIIRDTSLKKMLIDVHDQDANKGKIKGQISLENIFGFCKTFKKVTKNLGFHITIKTTNLQDIIYTTIADGT